MLILLYMPFFHYFCSLIYLSMDPRNIHIEEYSYPLPDHRIARHPLQQRDACRLLVFRPGSEPVDNIFSALPSLLPERAMLVYNNTRVINARLRFHKTTGALIEIFCLEPAAPADYEQAFASRRSCRWHCLVGNSKKWKDGDLTMDVATRSGSTVLHARRVADVPEAADRSQCIEFEWDNAEVTLSDIITAVGEIPIPPYLNRRSEASDSTDYQTVYSIIDGSVAAPTAGLHFTPGLLEALDSAGIERRQVTLHVGAGTFRPVKADTIGGHDMHSEYITVAGDFISDLREALTDGRPIVAVGTTSVRTLESLYHIGVAISHGTWDGELPQWAPYDAPSDMSAPEALGHITDYLAKTGSDVLIARTRIIIAPGYSYRIVSAMITNFHQPQSTLLLLVSAFIGPQWRDVYNHALTSDYRFLSYGDACLFFKDESIS